MFYIFQGSIGSINQYQFNMSGENSAPLRSKTPEPQATTPATQTHTRSYSESSIVAVPVSTSQEKPPLPAKPTVKPRSRSSQRRDAPPAPRSNSPNAGVECPPSSAVKCDNTKSLRQVANTNTNQVHSTVIAGNSSTITIQIRNHKTDTPSYTPSPSQQTRVDVKYLEGESFHDSQLKIINF